MSNPKNRLIFKNAETPLIAIGVYFRGNALYFPSALFFRSRDLLQTAFGPSDRNRAKLPKNAWIFASPGKWGKKLPENGKNRPKMARKMSFLVHFPFFSHFFAHLPGEAITHFLAISPNFGPKTRKQSVAGQRDRKVSVLFLSRQSDLRKFNKLHLHPGNFFELFFWGIDLITLTLTLLNVFELET